MPPKKTLNQKENKQVEKTQSPYRLFSDWLFDDNLESVLPDWVIGSLAPHMILQMFCASNSVTVFLNDTFNNYYLFKLNKYEFFKYLKQVVYKKRITRNKMCFFQHRKLQKDIVYLRSYFPQLKIYELEYLLKEIEKDKEFNDEFLVTLGLKDEKRTKLTVAEKKEYNSNHVTQNKTKECKKEKQITLDDWENNFK